MSGLHALVLSTVFSCLIFTAFFARLFLELVPDSFRPEHCQPRPTNCTEGRRWSSGLQSVLPLYFLKGSFLTVSLFAPERMRKGCASRAGHSENYWTQMRFSRENPETCPRRIAVENFVSSHSHQIPDELERSAPQSLSRIRDGQSGRRESRFWRFHHQ